MRVVLGSSFDLVQLCPRYEIYCNCERGRFRDLDLLVVEGLVNVFATGKACVLVCITDTGVDVV